MNISATQVKELREKTGVGMMECKKALTESAGDMEKAIVWLREKGLARAAKKADRVAAEGIVGVIVNDDKNVGALIEVNCETDFVAKNEDFQKLVQELSAVALKHKPDSAESFGELSLGGKKIKDVITDKIATIGENIQIRRVKIFSTTNGMIVGYSHMGGKIGSMVVLEGKKDPKVEELGKDIAMHVAASMPKYLKPDEVEAAELEQEKEIGRKKLAEENKPADIIEKILVGQIQKFYKEVCLLEQPFVKEPKQSVSQVVKASGLGVNLTSFGRFQLGEGIEKKSTDFAAEVAAALKQ